MHRTTLSLPVELWKRLRWLAIEEGRSVTALVAEMIEKGVAARSPSANAPGQTTVDDIVEYRG